MFTELPRVRGLLGKWASRLVASSKNRRFTSCAGSLKSVGLVAVTGLVDAVNFAIQPGSSTTGRYLNRYVLLTRDRSAYVHRPAQLASSMTIFRAGHLPYLLSLSALEGERAIRIE